MLRIVIVVGALALGCPAIAGAQRELDAEETQLALAVAQVCANEHGLGVAMPADCALIWQAVRRHGRTALERLEWLRGHSSCVLTDRPMTEREARGNCPWSRTLTDSDEAPSGWNETVPWPRYIDRWARMRRYCRSLVRGARPRAGWPCSEDPDTWGGPMDRVHAARAGMRPLFCAGTVNEGYRYGEALASVP